MKKQALAAVLALALCLALAVVPASADGYGCEPLDPADYTLKNGELVIREGVTEIPVGAFGQDWRMPGDEAVTGHNIISVVIPNSVRIIGEGAFGDCDSMTSLTIGRGVTEIEGRAFESCTSLTTVTIPEGVTRISYAAFRGCTGLISVTIPSSMTEIGQCVFQGCTSLTSVTIPASVTNIIDLAFLDCTSLKDVYYEGDKEQWNAIEIGDDNDTLTSAAIHYNSPMPDKPAATFTATPTNDVLRVDGKVVTPTTYKINGANYVKLRDVAMLISGTAKQFNVSWDPETRFATIITEQKYVPNGSEMTGVPTANETAIVSNDKIIINDQVSDLTVYKIGGTNYVQLRELSIKLNFNVGYKPGIGAYIDGNSDYDPTD